MTTKLICPDCGHENETERIYCHDCGARLDRSGAKSRHEPAKDAQQRMKKMFDPKRGQMRSLFFKISKLALGSCVIAALIQMGLPPDVPEVPKDAPLASQIRFDLENMVAKHRPPELQYTEDQVNGFLQYALKSKQASLNKPLLDFKHAVVRFGEGTCDVTAERSFFGYSIFTSCAFRPALHEGKIVAPSNGGAIGRMPVHPQIAQWMSVFVADVFFALDSEIKLVRKSGTLEFHDKNVVLRAPPM